jgi:dTDP-4-amino-4,6-dideoxygalactose transaminase
MSQPLLPINSLQRHVAPLRARLAAAAAEVIDTGHYVLGPGVAAFEQAFAAYCGTGACVGVGNGTDALEIALRALGVGAGDQVALCANAAMYSTTATLALGAEPVFVDVLPGEATMDPAQLERVLGEHPRVRAVVATHLYGRLARVGEIAALCAARGVRWLEDCAQAHGARDAQGRRAGSFADLASFSFYPTKNLGALGDGGAIVGSDEGLMERVRRLRQYGWSAKYLNTDAGGRNSRLDEIQARLLSVMLPELDAWNARRRDIANAYAARIRNSKIEVMPPSGEEYVGHLYVVRCDQRDALRAHLTSEGVQNDVHYPLPDHRQPCHQGRYEGVALPVTEDEALRVLTLPCFPELTDEEVGRVVDACNRF